MLEVFKLVKWTRQRSSTEIQIRDKVEKVRNLFDCVLEFATLEIGCLVFASSLNDCLSVANAACQRCDATVIEHEVHGDVKPIDSVVVDLLMDLREGQSEPSRHKDHNVGVFRGCKSYGCVTHQVGGKAGKPRNTKHIIVDEKAGKCREQLPRECGAWMRLQHKGAD